MPDAPRTPEEQAETILSLLWEADLDLSVADDAQEAGDLVASELRAAEQRGYSSAIEAAAAELHEEAAANWKSGEASIIRAVLLALANAESRIRALAAQPKGGVK